MTSWTKPRILVWKAGPLWSSQDSSLWGPRKFVGWNTTIIDPHQSIELIGSSAERLDCLRGSLHVHTPLGLNRMDSFLSCTPTTEVASIHQLHYQLHAETTTVVSAVYTVYWIARIGEDMLPWQPLVKGTWMSRFTAWHINFDGACFY